MVRPGDVDAGPWHVRGVWLPDGDEPQDWWIADGRMTDRPVAHARDLPVGWVLLGGLVDAHVHLTMNFGRVMPFADGSDALIAANAAAQRRAGVLALRDAGVAWGGLPRQTADGPRLQRAGSLMAPPGRGYPNVCRPVSADEIVETALDEVAAGADWVKVLADFPGPDGNWFAAPSNYPRDVLTRLVREVHAAGARVMGHTTGLGSADLVAAGVDSIEHGTAVTEHQVREMSARGIAWTPTLATVHKHVGGLAGEASPVGAYIRAQLDRLREMLALASELGVPILAGTDEIGMGAIATEVEWLGRFGVAANAALAAASTAARSWLGFPPVGVNSEADLVIYADDPRRDPAVLAHPISVMYGGRLV